MLDSITILGPTATGKTALAVALAKQIESEIISVDSRQVYRKMDIGTGKDLSEYDTVAYHLINIVDAGTRYTLNQYQVDFKKAFDSILQRGKTPILCGGTGLYLEAVLNGFQRTQIPNDDILRNDLETKTDEELLSYFNELNTTEEGFDTSTRKRLVRAIEILSSNLSTTSSKGISTVAFGIDMSVEMRRNKITKRLHERLNNGMIEEVEQLLASGISNEDLIYYGLEYKYITQYLTGEMTRDEMTTKLNTDIHRFAKRQMTWYRRMERNGLTIHWIDHSLPTSKKVEYILSKI